MSALTRTIVTCDCGIACGWKGGDVTLLLPTEGSPAAGRVAT